MKDKLYPITLTRKISDLHCGGFSMDEEKALGFAEGELFETPSELHELVTFHKKNLGRNLELYKEKYLNNNSNYKEIKTGVFAHINAQIDEQVVFNTKDGIIVIEKNVHVNPFSYLVGPLRIDENVTINPHASITNSYIGKFSKVGGEISNSVIESYSNKSHHGFLGDAYVGSWVNIGGGASFSNVKNTYGNIKMGGVETGEMRMGPIIADYVKVAINVSVYTGKIIGTGAHIYGTVETDVPNFVNYFSKDKMTEIPIEITEKIAERMMARRNKQFLEEDKKVLEYAYRN